MKKPFIAFIICLLLLTLSSICWARPWFEYEQFDEQAETAAIERDPRNPALYIRRADFYARDEKWTQAIADYEKALSIDPRNQGAYQRLGAAYISVATKKRDRQEAKTNFEKAVSVFDQLIKLNPPGTDTYYERGAAYQGLGNCAADFTEASRAYVQAVDNYSKAIALDQEYFKAYEGRCDIYMTTGEYDKAIQDYTYLIERPRIGWLFRLYYYNRGYAHACKGEYDKALAEYDKLLAENRPSTINIIEAYKERGKIYLRRKQYDAAIADFTQVIRRSEFATTEMLIRDTEHNVSWLHIPKEASKLQCAEVLYLRAGAYYAQGEYDKAFADCTRALELYSDYTDARTLKAQVYKVLSKG